MRLVDVIGNYQISKSTKKIMEKWLKYYYAFLTERRKHISTFHLDYYIIQTVLQFCIVNNSWFEVRSKRFGDGV